MPRIVTAQLVTPAGDRIQGEVKNLTATGMFVAVRTDVRIGQSLTAKLLGHAMSAQVLFISDEPEGFVVSLRPNEKARDTILGAAHEVEILEPKDDGMWSEETNQTNVDLPDEDEAEAPQAQTAPVIVAPRATSSIEDSQPELAADLVVAPVTDAVAPINPFLIAAAERDDSSVSVEVPAPAYGTDLAIEAEPVVESTDSAHATVDGLPAFSLAAIPEIADEGSTESSSEIPVETLPTLGDDGHTVKFESSDAYEVQYTANIEHGGLVVLAGALPIGTQRMLALDVPGSDKYTVSARVIYHQDGKVGFMLDSFNIHKARLKQLGID